MLQTPADDTKKIPREMWDEIARVDKIQGAIHVAALEESRRQIKEIGGRYGFTVHELEQRGVIVAHTKLANELDEAAARIHVGRDRRPGAQDA